MPIMSGPSSPPPHGASVTDAVDDAAGPARTAAPTVGTRAAAVKTEDVARDETPARAPIRAPTRAPTRAQRAWLARGLDQPGGKLPLFDRNGRRINARIVKACLDAGWAEPWFANPVKPDWQICKLTDAGRALVAPADGTAPGETEETASPSSNTNTP
jgi:hypothetical protein